MASNCGVADMKEVQDVDDEIHQAIRQEETLNTSKECLEVEVQKENAKKDGKENGNDEGKETLNADDVFKTDNGNQDNLTVEKTVAGPSSTDQKPGENSSKGQEQRTRKRERCDDNVDESDCEECKRRDVARSHSTSERGPDGDNSDRNESNAETYSFPRLRTETRQRRYRRPASSSSSSSSSASIGNSNNSSPSSSSSSDERLPDDTDSSDDSVLTDRILGSIHNDAWARVFSMDSDDTWSHIDSDNSESDDGDEEESKDNPHEDDKNYPKCLTKEVPKHKWNVMKTVLNRQIGLHTQQQDPELFWKHCYGSLHSVKRLKLLYKLDEHLGCVNAVSFNETGTRLVSGSDDKKIIMWDWAAGKSLLQYSTGHTSNVFQAKFLPMAGDTHIVSSARDGQVRLASLSSTGECRSTRRLANHRKAVNKLALLPETPHVLFSAGEDGRVMSIDVRANKPSTILTVNNGNRNVGLNSVDIHPLNSNEFCVCGSDTYIRIYDKRNIDLNGNPMKKFCPSHIEGAKKYTNVTCALYNHDGSEVIGSYNDENLYLFDTRHSDGADFVHKYEGHRNSDTVKGCDFFGPNSEYVMSGSDCGHIFFWDKNTEAIVQFMKGDEKGVVNVLVGHPQFPILATSGLDSDVKIWIPSSEKDPEMKELKKVVASNIRDRVNYEPFRMDVFESHLSMGLDQRFGVQLGDGGPIRFRAVMGGDFHISLSDSSNSDDDD